MLTTTDLLGLARRCAERTAGLTTKDLDDWYEEHVGYRLLEDDPAMGAPEHLAMVAAAMFYHSLSQGADTPMAEATCDLLVAHIERGEPL